MTPAFSKLTMAILVTFVCTITFGQTNWLHHEGGANADEVLSIANDWSGNIYSTGYFNSLAQFQIQNVNSN